MAKNIKSTDPRKPAIVAALKRLSGGTKVTNVFEAPHSNGFMGNCFTKRAPYHGWDDLGSFTVFALTDEQRQALKDYATWADATYGGGWKQQLSIDWLNDGSRFNDHTDRFTILYRLRSSHGPGWLSIFEL